MVIISPLERIVDKALENIRSLKGVNIESKHYIYGKDENSEMRLFEFCLKVKEPIKFFKDIIDNIPKTLDDSGYEVYNIVFETFNEKEVKVSYLAKETKNCEEIKIKFYLYK